MSGKQLDSRTGLRPTSSPPAASLLVLERDPNEPGLDVRPYVFESQTTRIGRLPGAARGLSPTHELILPHDSVSREHAEVVWENSRFILKDSKSSNGTFVNNFRIESFPIRHGDRIAFGELKFIIRRHTPSKSLVHDEPTRQAPNTRVSERPDLDGSNSSLPRVHRRSESGLDIGAFGVVNLSNYSDIATDLSEIGIRRLEVSIANIVAEHLDLETSASREYDSGSLRILLKGPDESALKSTTGELARALKVVISELSWRGYSITSSTSKVDPKIALQKAIAGQSGQLRRARASRLQSAANTVSECRWIHVSDLHFGAGSASWRHDHQQVMSSLIRDLERNPFSAHRIFVSGDVAFSGAAEQYETAIDELRRLASAVNLSLNSVRVTPGNHDVDRKVAGTPLLAALHYHARSSTTALDEMLTDARTRGILAEKLACFQRFISRIPGHPSDLDWHERLKMGSAYLDIWGLCSVWCSDSDDGINEHGGFSANMPIGKSQYHEYIRERIPAEFNVLMTHHPLEWISGSHARWLRSAFAVTPYAHLCGHIHQHGTTTTIDLGKLNNGCTMVAGAGHSAQGESVTHSYSRCIIRRNSDRGWSVGWSPRLYDLDRNEFRLDRGRLDLDNDGYAWLKFSQSAESAPTVISARPTTQLPTVVTGPHPNNSPPPIPKKTRSRPK